MTRREAAVVSAAGALRAILLTWPLVLHLGSELPGADNRADPLLEAWTVAWGGHALLHAPLHFFDANVFWPLGHTLAFSESLAGFAPLGLLGSGPKAAIVHYDLLFLFAYALAFVGAYALARELGARPGGAAVAAAVFAWAPFRLAHASHLHVLSSGGIPLSLALLVRGLRSGSSRLVVAGWLVALWQISLGWNLGLPFVYLLAVLGAGVALALRRRRPPRALAAATLAGAAAAFAGALLLALPYIHVLHEHPEARRTPDILFFFSPAPRSLLAAPATDLVWGGPTARFRLEPAEEKTLFLGLAASLLAIVGLVAGAPPARLRLGLGVATVAFALLSLGFGLHGGQGGYRLLYDYAPGWQGLRTPGRLVTFTALAVALLAALGADRVTTAARRLGRSVPFATAAVLVLLPLLEGAGHVRLFRPDPPPAAVAAPGPQLVLPADRDLTNARAMFWSIGRFQHVANGWSGFHPSTYVALVDRIHSFPDAASVRTLRAAGIRSVILDRAAARGTAWASAATRPVAALPLERTASGGYVLYALRPASASR